MSCPPFLLAITSLKPHAGRTTAAMAIARALGRAGQRTLLVDANRYPTSIPSKSKTGSAELWEHVVLGSRKAGEAAALGARIVVVDAPPLIEEKAGKILSGADATVVTAFPIVQNKRFMSEARGVLEELDPERVLGWFPANVDESNRMHRDLVEELRQELQSWQELGTIPADARVPHWDMLAAAEPPDGEFEEVFTQLAASLLERMDLPSEGESHASQEEKSADPTPRRNPTAAPESEDAEKKPRRTKRSRKTRKIRKRRSAGTAVPQAKKAEAPSAPAEQPRRPREERAVRTSVRRNPLEALPPRADPTRSAPLRWFGRRPRLSFSLMDQEAGFVLRPGVSLFPRGLPMEAMGPMLRYGLLHSLDAAKLLGEHDVSRRRLHLQEDPDAPGKDEPFIEALVPDGYGLHLAGDLEGALIEFEQQEGADSRLLAGVLRLSNGEHAEAVDHLEAALADRGRLGYDLGMLGLGVLVDVDFGNGVTTHFGSNLRGVRMALAMAHLLLEDEERCLEELEALDALGPVDDVLTALRAELLLGRGGEEGLRAVHRSLVVPTHETALHIVLSMYRSEALAGLGLAEPACQGLDEALEAAPRPSPLRRAILLQRAWIAESLGRRESARRDLELLQAENPEDQDVALRLAS